MTGTTPHSTTGSSSAEILFKASPRTVMHHMHPYNESRVVANQFSQRDRTTKSRENRSFHVGETVYVKDFRVSSPNKWASGTVLALRGPLSYLVQVGTDVWRRHVDQIRGADDLRLNDDGEEHARTVDPMTVPFALHQDSGESQRQSADQREVFNAAPEAAPRVPDSSPDAAADDPVNEDENPEDSTSLSVLPDRTGSSPVLHRYPARVRKPPNWFLTKGGK